MIEKIVFKEDLLAIIVRANYSENGISFFTSDEFSQQLAFMKHPKGKVIFPHIHNVIRREIFDTNEVLFIKKGKLRIDFYDKLKNYLESRILYEEDVVILFGGAHGFSVLEDIEMFEVKQGPYAGENDKIKFDSIDEKEIKIVTNEPNTSL